MRQLFPEAADDVDPLDCYRADHRPAPPQRPWVLLNMVTSLDGGTAVDGRSGALGGPADKTVFAAVRAIADVVLVAAGTVRAEHYGAPRPREPDAGADRAAPGRPPARIAVVTASLDLDLSSGLFQDPTNRPIMLTVDDAPAARRDAIANRADVVEVGHGQVDLARALTHLRHEVGAEVVVCEGGPTLNGALIAADLVDELCLSVSNLLIGGPSSRMAHTSMPSVPRRLHLKRVLEKDELLFLRYAC